MFNDEHLVDVAGIIIMTTNEHLGVLTEAIYVSRLTSW